MRVLVVDQDSASNEAIARSLRDLYTVDAVTNKGDCLDLLRANTYEVIVATERLEDGSGLELLGQIAKKWPSVLRIFAADRQRLQLLKGRLGPFELFQTLTYPIDPDRLIATLSLADAAQDANADTSNIQHVVLSGEAPAEVTEESEQPQESEDFPAPRPQARVVPLERPQSGSRFERGAARGGPGRSDSMRGGPARDDSSQAGPDRSDSTRTGSDWRNASDSVRSTASMRPRQDGAAGPPTTRSASGIPAARGAAPSPSISSSEGRPLRHGRPRIGANKPPPVRFPPLEPPQDPTASRTGPSGVDSFAEAAAMARAARSNLESPPEEFDTKRLTVMVGTGAAIVLVVIALGFKIFGSKSEAPRPAAPAVAQAPQYPRDVTDLVAQTESALKADDYKGAEANVNKLKQIAPSHPRLAFFEGLLAQRRISTKSTASTASKGHGNGKGNAPSSRRSGTNTPAEDKSGSTANAAGSTGIDASGAGTAARARNDMSTGSGANAAPPAVASAGESSASPGEPTLPPETPPGMTRSSPTTVASGAVAGTGSAAASPAAASPAAALPAAASPPGTNSGTSSATSPATSAAASSAPPSGTGTSSLASVAAASTPASAPAATITSPPRRPSSGEPPPVIQEAKLIRRVNPDYPSAAKRDAIHGSVDLEVTVSTHGVVQDISVIKSTPSDIFEKSALAAVRKWRYDPRFVDGLPSIAHLKVHLDFEPGK